MKKTIPRHIIFKLVKMSDKEILNAAREKRHSIQRNKDKDDSFLSSIM